MRSFCSVYIYSVLQRALRQGVRGCSFSFCNHTGWWQPARPPVQFPVEKILLWPLFPLLSVSQHLMQISPRLFMTSKFHMFYCFVSLVFSAGVGESECSSVLIAVNRFYATCIWLRFTQLFHLLVVCVCVCVNARACLCHVCISTCGCEHLYVYMHVCERVCLCV